MSEDTRDAKSTIASLLWGGLALVVIGVVLVAFADPITGGSPDSLEAVGYVIAALASLSVTAGLVAYAVSLGIRASR